MKIILNGTSSSGKTTIMKLLPKKYKKVSLDEYRYKVWCSREIEPHERLLKNKYYTHKEKLKINVNQRWQYYKMEINNSNNFIIDTVLTLQGYHISSLKKYLSIKNLKCVLLFTNFSNLIRNIEKRRNYDPRTLGVFNNFTDLYTYTDYKNEAIGVVCLKDFIKDLKNVKYFFSSEKELITFAKKIFKQLKIKNIKLTKKYYIKPVDKYDIVLDSTNKTPEQLIKELKKNINN